MTDALTVKLGTDLCSGIKPDGQIENDPRGFLVTWIDWDSDFRRHLRINDLIVGVNGQSLAPFLQPGKMGKGVGQPGEPSYWNDIGAKHDDVIALSVLRDGEPVTVEGKLHLEYFYYDAQGKTAIARADRSGSPMTASTAPGPSGSRDSSGSCRCISRPGGRSEVTTAGTSFPGTWSRSRGSITCS